MKAPLWSWANLLSLDAVAVGVLWQWLFAFEFCGRLPTLPESGIVGSTIWLAYTADRLLDSLHLDRSRPHTLRHRLHFEWKNYLVAAWVVVLAIDAMLVVVCATDSQLRWGYAAIAIVLAYIAGVHFTGDSLRWFPKELQAGMVFAFGISLVAWCDGLGDDVVSLFLSTLLAGCLFAANCFAVAQWENDLDVSQGFASWVTRYCVSPRWLPIALLGHGVITISLLAMHIIPPLIAGCLIASGLLMLAVVLASREGDRSTVARTRSLASPSVSGVIADMALVIPPIASTVAVSWFQ